MLGFGLANTLVQPFEVGDDGDDDQNFIQLNGKNLQLNGRDLVLGEP